MGIESIIDAWAAVRDAGAPIDAFLKWFSEASFALEESGDEAAELSLEIRLVLAEMNRDDLSQADAIGEIDKLIPATSSRPLHRSVVPLGALPRDEWTSETFTRREDVIPAGR